jgi:hypothetical protein
MEKLCRLPFVEAMRESDLHDFSVEIQRTPIWNHAYSVTVTGRQELVKEFTEHVNVIMLNHGIQTSMKDLVDDPEHYELDIKIPTRALLASWVPEGPLTEVVLTASMQNHPASTTLNKCLGLWIHFSRLQSENDEGGDFSGLRKCLEAVFGCSEKWSTDQLVGCISRIDHRDLPMHNQCQKLRRRLSRTKDLDVAVTLAFNHWSVKSIRYSALGDVRQRKEKHWSLDTPGGMDEKLDAQTQNKAAACDLGGAALPPVEELPVSSEATSVSSTRASDREKANSRSALKPAKDAKLASVPRKRRRDSRSGDAPRESGHQRAALTQTSASLMAARTTRTPEATTHRGTGGNDIDTFPDLSTYAVKYTTRCGLQSNRDLSHVGKCGGVASSGWAGGADAVARLPQSKPGVKSFSRPGGLRTLVPSAKAAGAEVRWNISATKQSSDKEMWVEAHTILAFTECAPVKRPIHRGPKPMPILRMTTAGNRKLKQHNVTFQPRHDERFYDAETASTQLLRRCPGPASLQSPQQADPASDAPNSESAAVNSLIQAVRSNNLNDVVQQLQTGKIRTDSLFNDRRWLESEYGFAKGCGIDFNMVRKALKIYRNAEELIIAAQVCWQHSCCWCSLHYSFSSDSFTASYPTHFLFVSSTVREAVVKV